MNKLCRIGFVIRSLSQFPIQRLVPFSSSSAANPIFLNSSTDEEEIEDGGTAVYRNALKTQRPTTIKWTPRLANSANLIGYVDRYPKIYDNEGSKIGAFTYLSTRKRHDLYRGFRIQVEMWGDMAKMCIQHLKPDDLVYVSGRLVSYALPSVNENEHPCLRHKIIVRDLYYIAQPEQRQTCDNPEESKSEVSQKVGQLETSVHRKYKESERGETGTEMYKNRLYLWQMFFNSPHEWWDNRNDKKSSRSPDFKHRDTGEGLWLDPNDPSWVKIQLQLLDSKKAELCLDAGPRFHSCVSQWVYDE